MPLAPAHPAGQNASMDQDRADYTDYESVRRERPRRPWTLLQEIAILIVAILLCLPLACIAVVAGGIILSGGMQH